MELKSLCDAVNVWYSRASVDELIQTLRSNNNELVRQMHTFFRALAVFAFRAFHCPHLSDGIVSTADILTGGGAEATISTANNSIMERREQTGAASFLRAVTQCTELGLKLCVYKQGGGARFVDDHGFRSSVWTIMAAMEPRLFLDPRPFWVGTAQTNLARPLWQLYGRLFLLVGFEVQYRLRQERLGGAEAAGPYDDDEPASWVAEEYEGFDPERDRRPFRHPCQVGLGSDPEDDEYDPADAESWTMSMLFGCLDVLADEWNRALYTPAVLELVARCLIRYAMIGYIRTPPDLRARAQQRGVRCVHDMPEYTVQGVHRARGWIGVHHEVYYDQGGAVLRDILRDLCRAALVDVWVCQLTVTAHVTEQNQNQRDGPSRCLARRLYGTMIQRLRHLQMSGDDGDRTEAVDFEANRTDLLFMKSVGVRMLGSFMNGPLRQQPKLETVEWMQEVSRRCFHAMAMFLDGGSGAEAEKTIGQSGVVQLILPGEIWRFANRWPNMGVTPVNILNGLRPRDMTLYQEQVMGQRISVLVSTRGRGLPACLAPMVDHVVLETFRHMMRIVTTLEGTEAFPYFLIEPHQWQSILLKEANDSDCPYRSRFFRWTRLVRHVVSSSSSQQQFSARTWNRIYDTVARVLVDTGPTQLRGGVSEYPPFPQILLLGGRCFLWNPLAKPVPDEQADPDEAVFRALAPYWEQVRPWLSYPLLEVSTNATSMTLVLWLYGRLFLVGSLLRRLDPENQDHRIAMGMGRAKLDMYQRLLERLLRDPNLEQSDSGRGDGEDDQSVFYWEPMQITPAEPTNQE